MGGEGDKKELLAAKRFAMSGGWQTNATKRPKKRTKELYDVHDLVSR